MYYVSSGSCVTLPDDTLTRIYSPGAVLNDGYQSDSCYHDDAERLKSYI